MTQPCFACQTAEKHPSTTLRGPGCLACDARILAVTYGGMAREQIDPVLHAMWPTAAEFKKGRLAFWLAVRAIEEAKEKT